MAAQCTNHCIAGTTIYNTEHYTALFKLSPIISNPKVMTNTLD